MLDMNANHFGSADRAGAAVAAGFTKSVFGSLGMRFISTLLGGILAGSPEEEIEPAFAGASRGFMFVAIDPDTVGDAADFKTRARRIIDDSLTLDPITGAGVAALPGTLEWRREQACRTGGIPIPDDHRKLLEQLALDLRLAHPNWM